MCYWQTSEQLLICGLLLIRIGVWSSCSFLSVRLIMPRNVSPPLIPPTKAGKGKWGAGVNLGQIPREKTTSKFPTPLKRKAQAMKKNKTKKKTACILLVLSLWTSQVVENIHVAFYPCLLWSVKKAAVVIYCSINALNDWPMRQPVPLFACGLRDNGEFSELKH